MIEILAQATQPDPALQTWVWNNLPWEKLTLYILGVGAVATTAVAAIYKLIIFVLEQTTGIKTRRVILAGEVEKTRLQVQADLEKMREDLKAIAKTSDATTAEPTPQDIERVKKMAGEG